MNNFNIVISVLSLLFFTFTYIFIPREWVLKVTRRVSSSTQTTPEMATKALEQLGDWTKWTAGIEVAAIAFMGFLVDDLKCNFKSAKVLGFGALLFFMASIVLCAFLLSGIPSMQIRLKDRKTVKNDVFEKSIYGHTQVRAGTIFGLLQFYFVIGLLFLVGFTLSILN